MLTEKEKSLIQRTFAQGPAALVDDGYDDEAIKDFLERPDVRAHFTLLQREMDHHDVLAARQQWMARRNVGKLAQGAVAVLAQALAGPQYLTVVDNGQHVIARDAAGKPIVSRPEPTSTQLRAVELVLDALGVPQQKAKNEPGATDLSVEVLFKGDVESTVKIDHDPTHTKESQRALSRERVRTVIEVLSNKVPELHQKVLTNLGLGETEPTKPRRKRSPRKKPSGRKKTLDR